MKCHAEIAPLQTSFVLSTQCPCPPSGAKGGKRGSMSAPRRRSSLPPLPPKTRTTSKQTESQNFNPGPKVSQPLFSFGSSMMTMTPAPSPSALVADENAAVPFMRPTTSVSDDRRWAYSDNNSADMEMIYPKPIEMPVGVNHSKKAPGGENAQSHGEPASFMDEYITAYMELDKFSDISIKNDDVERIISTNGDSENGKSSSSGSENRRNATNSSVKKRAYSRRTRKSTVPSVADCNLNALGIEKGKFTATQMEKIARCGRLRKLVVTDPKYVKRILLNRESGARSNAKKAKHVLEMEEAIQTLEKEVATVTAHTSYAERTKLGLEEENMKIRIRLQELEEQAKFGKALTEYFNGEINRLKEKGTGEVIPNREILMDEDMLMEQLSLDEEPQTNYYGFE